MSGRGDRPRASGPLACEIRPLAAIGGLMRSQVASRSPALWIYLTPTRSSGWCGETRASVRWLSSVSVIEDCQVELAQARGVSDHVTLDNLPMHDPEVQYP